MSRQARQIQADEVAAVLGDLDPSPRNGRDVTTATDDSAAAAPLARAPRAVETPSAPVDVRTSHGPARRSRLAGGPVSARLRRGAQLLRARVARGPADSHAVAMSPAGAPLELVPVSAWASASGVGRRVLLWGALAVVLLLGVKQLVVGTPKAVTSAAPAVGVPVAVSFPSAAASSVAASFAAAYLQLDPASAPTRAATLAGLLGKDLDPGMGWNGQGSQQVNSVAVTAVSAASAAAATVTVTAVVTSPLTADPAAASEPHGVALLVPVAAAGSRVVVSGLPALSGAQGPPTAPARVTGDTDSVATQATSAFAAQFFAAYGGGAADAVAALAAPGVALSPVPGLALVSVQGWTVYAPGRGSSDRPATARVAWSMPGGTQLVQLYSLELTSVGQGSAAKWFVAAITAG